MVVYLEVVKNQVVEISDAVKLPARERKIHLDTVVPLCLCGLHIPAHHRTMRANVLQVKGGGDYFNVVEGELGTLRNNLPVAGDHGAPIVVETISVTSLLVGIQIYSSKLSRNPVSYEHGNIHNELTLSVASLISSTRV